MEEQIVNKVAQSGIITINLENFIPEGELSTFDMKDYLFQGLMLREKDFRAFVKEHDWSAYSGRHVAITCSADAIVPTWAYMLVSNRLQPHARTVIFGDLQTLRTFLFHESLKQIDPADYIDARVVIKGCGDKEVGPEAYVEITRLLSPVVKSLMFGEPCSTVPVYKRK